MMRLLVGLALFLEGLLGGPLGAARVSAATVPTWVAPLAGPLVVRRGFAPPTTRWGAGHRGVDLAADPGAIVRAAGAGQVSFAGLVASRGVLAVRHGMLRTTYEPTRPIVRAGDQVARGQPIAVLESGHGAPTRLGEFLLHWGLLVGDAYRNPLYLLAGASVRLLPLVSSPGRRSAGTARPPPAISLPTGQTARTPAVHLSAPAARSRPDLRPLAALGRASWAIPLLAVAAAVVRRPRNRAARPP